MAEIIRMPKLSDTMTEGVIVKWYKKVGDKVAAGEIIADIETDKATMEFESFQSGTLLFIGVETGKAVPIDSIIAILGKEGEDVKALIEEEKKKSAVSSQQSTVKKPVDEIKKEIIAETPITDHRLPITNSSDSRTKASPLAKKLAREKGIDLSRIQGSGDAGRVVKRDVYPVNLSAYKPAADEKESYTEVEISQMRKTIAKRLSESKYTSPHFYLTIEIDMDNAVSARNSINAVSDVKISFNDIIIKAAALTLKEHPKVNASWLGDKIRYNNHVHIGVAVAVEEGLLVPVVRFADGKPLSHIAMEVKILVEKAQNKMLQPADWEGNTFTISNLGMFGIEEFTGIINPPDACLMTVGAIRKAAVIKNNMVVAADLMKITLSCDHRLVDGVIGAKFLQTFKFLMENPVVLLGRGEI